MAGRGPAPKDRDQRARRNADPVASVELDLQPAPQPKLPSPPKWLGRWPAATQRWWVNWGESPQAALFTAMDWDVLVDTALLHARFWQKGETSVAAELRLRVAKFGATIEDRARLRMTAAPPADEGEPDRRPAAARERYGNLRMLPGAQTS